MGIIPSKKRWERKQKARDRSVKFQGKSPTQENKPDVSPILKCERRKSLKTCTLSLPQMSTLERKKKNFSFTRKFPFMKSRDNIDDVSEGERKNLILSTHWRFLVMAGQFLIKVIKSFLIFTLI
jgi:disks large protein 1